MYGCIAYVRSHFYRARRFPHFLTKFIVDKIWVNITRRPDLIVYLNVAVKLRWRLIHEICETRFTVYTNCRCSTIKLLNFVATKFHNSLRRKFLWNFQIFQLQGWHVKFTLSMQHSFLLLKMNQVLFVYLNATCGI